MLIAHNNHSRSNSSNAPFSPNRGFGVYCGDLDAAQTLAALNLSKDLIALYDKAPKNYRQGVSNCSLLFDKSNCQRTPICSWRYNYDVVDICTLNGSDIFARFRNDVGFVNYALERTFPSNEAPISPISILYAFILLGEYIVKAGNRYKGITVKDYMKNNNHYNPYSEPLTFKHVEMVNIHG